MASTSLRDSAGFDLQSALARFSLTASEAAHVSGRFVLAAAECRFTKDGDVLRALERFKGVPGIYFWLLRLDNERFKVYLGQTTSLSYRLTNYISGFQPHAPNDFKLRIFHEFVAERFSAAQFELHFSALTRRASELSELRRALTAAEHSALERFAPVLLNGRGRPSGAAKLSLERAFTEYYRSSFESLLATD